MSEVTQILDAIESGDAQSADQLLPLVYAELRRLAAAKLANEKPGQTLDATSLVHEAYLRLVPGGGRKCPEQAQRWNSRGHFFAAAAEAMRRILIERARRKATRKRGGRGRRLKLDQLDTAPPEHGPDLLVFDEALQELERHDRSAAQLVKLRFFGGLRHTEAAAALGLSRRAADRSWALARAWLYQRIGQE
jgi:RNA polymerase sigma factor (TIGR02999 family)